MKSNLLFILLITSISVLSFGCGGEDCEESLNIPSSFNQTVLDDNINTIENYLQTNGLTAQKTASNLYYIINEPGESNDNGVVATPDLCSTVTANYKGYLPDGTIFDQGTSISFELTRVITGWQEGIPLLGRGGDGVLLIPSYLAYGMAGTSANANGPGIPGNSVIIFDVELVDFN